MTSAQPTPSGPGKKTNGLGAANLPGSGSTRCFIAFRPRSLPPSTVEGLGVVLGSIDCHPWHTMTWMSQLRAMRGHRALELRTALPCHRASGLWAVWVALRVSFLAAPQYSRRTVSRQTLCLQRHQHTSAQRCQPSQARVSNATFDRYLAAKACLGLGAILALLKRNPEDIKPAPTCVRYAAILHFSGHLQLKTNLREFSCHTKTNSQAGQDISLYSPIIILYRFWLLSLVESRSLLRRSC